MWRIVCAIVRHPTKGQKTTQAPMSRWFQRVHRSRAEINVKTEDLAWGHTHKPAQWRWATGVAWETRNTKSSERSCSSRTFIKRQRKWILPKWQKKQQQLLFTLRTYEYRSERTAEWTHTPTEWGPYVGLLLINYAKAQWFHLEICRKVRNWTPSHTLHVAEINSQTRSRS